MNWLEELCKERGVSRYQVSKSTGISQQYLRKIVKDDIPMDQLRFCYYKSLCDFFDIHKDLKKIYSYHEFSTLEKVLNEFQSMFEFRELRMYGNVHLDDEMSMQEIESRSVELLKELSDVYNSLKKENFEVFVCKKNE